MYNYIEEIGRGGYGIVDKISDANGSVFARKTFHTAHTDTASLVNVKKRFIREANTQQQIQHKNIVPILAGGDLFADPPFYIMPLAVNSLERERMLDPELGGYKFEALQDILAGLEELHRLDIKHRDLKPANILQFKENNAPEGARDHYYAIGDFGLMSYQDTQLTTLTTTGMGRNSDYYTAPEIISDLRRATPQSDIFSVGCIIHDLFSTEDRVPLHEINENTPLGPIMRLCTRQDPKRRFKSVSALRDALLSYSANFGAASSTSQPILDLFDKAHRTSEEWNQILDFLQNVTDINEKNLGFGNLTLERIEELFNVAPEIANIVGEYFAEYVKGGTFSFASCDGLANRLKAFFDKGNLTTKVQCILALLYMGTSHNRWYVEAMFKEVTDNSMNQDLAERLAIEFFAEGNDICNAMDHIEWSIDFSRTNMHPKLQQALGQICPQ